MKIILIRHGQTTENVARRHQPITTKLSSVGRDQVDAVARELRAQYASDRVAILSSPLNRALETASTLAAAFWVIPSIDHSWRELDRPRHLEGWRHRSPRSLLYYWRWWRGSERARDTRPGESYAAVRARTQQAKVNATLYAEQSGVEVLLVVSHTAFINLFVAHVARTEPLSLWSAMLVFVRLLRMKNAAYITFEYIEGEWVQLTDLQVSKSLAR
jgi:broad specificity phosphatase PhoE